MIRTGKYILSVVLTGLILFAGLPRFSIEDANHDNRIDLEDVILQVKDVAESARHSGDLSISLGRAIESLNLLAGIKTVIQSDYHGSGSTNGTLLSTPFLISQGFRLKNSDCFIKTPALTFNFNSVDQSPDPPFPRAA